MSGASLGAFDEYLQQQRLVIDYMFISALAIFIYDYILTIQLEIKFIWFSPWGYTKVVFLIFRYTSFAVILLVLYNQTFTDVSAETCKVSYAVQLWSMVSLHAIIAELILSMRTWAVWNRNKVVGILLAVSIIASAVAECILLNNFVQGLEYAPPPYPGFRGCFIAKSDRSSLWGNYAALTAVQAIFLALMAISAFRSYRQGNFGRLSLIVYRDGILFYVYLLCISVANMTIVGTLPTTGMMTLLTPLEYTLYSVLTARIIFNIRDVGNRDLITDLHTTYEDSHPAIKSLHFVRPSRELSEDQTSLPLSLLDSQGNSAYGNDTLTMMA